MAAEMWLLGKIKKNTMEGEKKKQMRKAKRDKYLEYLDGLVKWHS